jgi:hypothetical protein
LSIRRTTDPIGIAADLDLAMGLERRDIDGRVYQCLDTGEAKL